MTVPTRVQKTFDCLDYKRRIQLQIYQEIKGMTHDQERVYFAEQATRGPLGDWWAHVRATAHGQRTA
jgi:hypothetical protein